MRHTLLFCGIACLILSGVADRAAAQPDTLWTRTFDLGTNSSLLAATELQAGGFIAVGAVVRDSLEDALIIRVDPLGDTLWTRAYGDVLTGQRAYDVDILNDGTIVVCGYDYTVPISCMVTGFSANGTQLWSKRYATGGQGLATDVLPLADGGFWIFGRKSVSNHGLDYWLIRCDANGDSLYSRTYGTEGTDLPDEVHLGNNNTLKLVGSRRNVTDQGYDVYVVTTDLQGNFIREDIFGGPLWEQAYASIVDSATGDLMIVGEIRATSNRDGYAARLDPTGEVLWEHSYSAGRLAEMITGVAPYLDGGFLLAGQTGGSVSSGQLWLQSIGVNGDTAWTWTSSVAGRSFADLRRIADGGFVVCGKANIAGRERCLMWRISPPSGISGEVRDRLTGELVPGVRIQVAELPQYSISDTVGRFALALPAGSYTLYSGGPCFSGDTLYGIEVIANENTLTDITVGVAHMTMNHSTINVLAKNREQGVADFNIYNEGSGDLVFSFETISLYPSEPWLSIEPRTGRVAPGELLVAQVIVEADTTDDGTYDYFGELRLHTNSCPETLRVVEVLAVVLDAESGPELPSEFALYPAYPNPFNSTTTLRFGLDHDADVSLNLFDVTGRQVATLIDNQRLSAGEHRMSFDANGLASGIYFARLQDQTRSQTQRLLYIR